MKTPQSIKNIHFHTGSPPIAILVGSAGPMLELLTLTSGDPFTTELGFALIPALIINHPQFQRLRLWRCSKTHHAVNTYHTILIVPIPDRHVAVCDFIWMRFGFEEIYETIDLSNNVSDNLGFLEILCTRMEPNSCG